MHKIVAGHLYKPTSKICAPVKLVKPTENYAKLQGDYGLSEVSILAIGINEYCFVISYLHNLNYNFYSFTKTALHEGCESNDSERRPSIHAGG